MKELINGLSEDQRIPSRDKKIILFIFVYIICPLDLIPDWTQRVGLIDDLVIFTWVLDYFFSVLDREVVLSHYPWGMRSFLKIKSVADLTSAFVPNFLRKTLWSYVGSPF